MLYIASPSVLSLFLNLFVSFVEQKYLILISSDLFLICGLQYFLLRNRFLGQGPQHSLIHSLPQCYVSSCALKHLLCPETSWVCGMTHLARQCSQHHLLKSFTHWFNADFISFACMSMSMSEGLFFSFHVYFYTGDCVIFNNITPRQWKTSVFIQIIFYVLLMSFTPFCSWFVFFAELVPGVLPIFHCLWEWYFTFVMTSSYCWGKKHFHCLSVVSFMGSLLWIFLNLKVSQ